jgi:murein L,D-transpeptidase YafK
MLTVSWSVLVLAQQSLADGGPGFSSIADFDYPCVAQVETSQRSLEVRSRLLGTVSAPGSFRRELGEKGFTPGDRVFFRIFKQVPGFSKGVLEAWMSKGTEASAPFELFKTYPMVDWGGALGPKLKEGDGQSPEGFYSINAELLNPYSSFHLSMNVGYPNDYDQSLGRTGSAIMIHGGSRSAGCYVVGDEQVEEVYVLAEAAFLNCVKEVPLAAFPFPLTQENLQGAAGNPWLSFWENIAEGFQLFELRHELPVVSAVGGRYYFKTSKP